MNRTLSALAGVIIALTISFIPPFSAHNITVDMAIQEIVKTNAIIDSTNRILYEEIKYKQLHYAPATVNSDSTISEPICGI